MFQLAEDKESIKKLNKMHTKGFNLMKRNLRKFVVNFETELEAFRASPDAEESEQEEEKDDEDSASGSDSDDNESVGFTAASFKKETSVVRLVLLTIMKNS